jgi:DNA invertase Pin-like site-specific DNA recombinase
MDSGPPRVVLSRGFGDDVDWSLTYPARVRRIYTGETARARGVSEPEAGRHSAVGAGVLIGYARCSTDKQDLAAQRQTLRQLGVSNTRLYLDHGMTGRTRRRPGLQQALAAVREGDTLVVPKLDRLARSVPDARAIGDSLTAGGVRLSIGGTVYDPADPMGKMFFNILATFAEFEVDLLRMRTREGMAIARANGKLKGKQPKLSLRQRAHVLILAEAGDHTIAELAELFSVSRATIYREIARARRAQPLRDRSGEGVQRRSQMAPAPQRSFPESVR